jgi:hypothetical protein
LSSFPSIPTSPKIVIPKNFIPEAEEEEEKYPPCRPQGITSTFGKLH